MPFGEALPAVRERDMELDDEMPVARLVERPTRTLAALAAFSAELDTVDATHRAALRRLAQKDTRETR